VRELRRPAKPGGDEQRAELVAVQVDGGGLIIQAPSDRGGWRVLEELLSQRADAPARFCSLVAGLSIARRVP
jgi:hypothetical protein